MQPLPLIQLAGELHRITTPHVIIGGLAAATYLPGRVTEDLDLLIHAPTADRLRAELDQFGATWRGRLAVGGATYQLPSGLLIDVIESTAPWVPSALSRPARTPSGFPIIRLPYLILLKLEASRARDVADISGILGRASDQQLDGVRQVIRAYLPDSLADLDSLIQLGRLEARAAPPPPQQTERPGQDPPAARPKAPGRDR